jgi:hypothetical protein
LLPGYRPEVAPRRVATIDCRPAGELGLLRAFGGIDRKCSGSVSLSGWHGEGGESVRIDADRSRERMIPAAFVSAGDAPGELLIQRGKPFIADP